MSALSSDLYAAEPPIDAKVGAALLQLGSATEDTVAQEAQTFSALIKGQGLQSLHGAIPALMAVATDKSKPHAQEASLAALTVLCGSLDKSAEPFLALALPSVLDVAASKDGEVRAQAEKAGVALMGVLAPAVRVVSSSVFDAMAQEKNWQTRVLALNLLAQCASAAPTEIAALMPEIVPQLTPSMTDTKKEVKKAAKKALNAALKVIDNKDINDLLPHIVTCIIKPEQTPELMHKLAAVVFVQTVDSPTLAVLVPLLIRGLREPATVTKRMTAVIIANMSKLVENPLEAAPFLPLLLPALEKVADTVSDPEARSVCEKAQAQLTRLHTACATVADGVGNTSPKAVLAIVMGAIGPVKTTGTLAASLDYVSIMCASLIDQGNKDVEAWSGRITPYLAAFLEKTAVASAVTTVHAEGIKMIKEIIEPEEEDLDGEEILADAEFTLAYGTKILLHNTRIKLKRGKRYGLLGPNDCGKTTLMRSISQEQIEGFPPASELRTVFVEADILGELSHLSCTDYVLADERIKSDGIGREAVRDKLKEVGWESSGGPGLDHGVDTLSGGWRMKLALTRAMLLCADILLFDEPTNHLDVMNVKWVKDYICSLDRVTSIMVSHDSGLLDDCCTHVLQIDNLKLKTYVGNLSQFVAKVPEARSYFDISKSTQTFTFPQPGPLEGVKSKGKALMKMQDVCYRYPINENFTIIGATVQVSLSSRVGCVGPNGAGKSTMIKCLTGEVEPTTGTRWAHPNLRMAYVAQHAFHHIESHLGKTPNEYIRWRYAAGDDKEAMNKVTMTVTEEEQAAMDAPIEFQWKDDADKIQKAKRFIEKLTGMRRQTKGGGKEYEYETKWKNIDLAAASWLSASKLIKAGWDKHVKAVDQKIAMMAGMYIRPLTTANVEKHLEDVGLDREFGTHYRMGALSGGQKVKVVVGAAMWNQPHIVILDEPTNYLDRDSLGALANAIIEYEGGVVIITHNDEFCRKICPERWVLQKMGDGIGRLDCQGDPEWMKHALEQKVEFKAAEEMVDASGNVTEVVQKKEMSKKEKKQKVKSLKAKIKAGEPLDSDEEDFALENALM